MLYLYVVFIHYPGPSAHTLSGCGEEGEALEGERERESEEHMNALISGLILLSISQISLVYTYMISLVFLSIKTI